MDLSPAEVDEAFLFLGDANQHEMVEARLTIFLDQCEMHRRVRSAGDGAADVFGPKMLRRRREVREARKLRKKFPAEDAEAEAFMRNASSLVDVRRVAERNLRVGGPLSSVLSPRVH